MRKWCLLATITLPLWLSACFPVPVLKNYHAHENHELTSKGNTTKIDVGGANRRDYFFGMALSGGGSRAANFETAVMLELDRLGILDRVQYISSVSGGSLPAVYYSLYKGRSDRWNEDNLRKTMSQNFQARAAWDILRAPYRLGYMGTSWDRTDVMADIFSRRLFDMKKFGDLPAEGPIPLIDATNFNDGSRFVFSNYSFNNLKSDLSAFPLGYAVAASAAFPALLRAVTLKNYRRKDDGEWADIFSPSNFQRVKYPTPLEYVHLIDGGIVDNLGIDSLARLYSRFAPGYEKGCLFIIVDAGPPYANKRIAQEPDTRRWFDFGLDSNVFGAIDILMQSKRDQQLERMGFDAAQRRKTLYTEPRQTGPNSYEWRVKDFKDIDQPASFLEAGTVGRLLPDLPFPTSEEEDYSASCRVWHIALADLAETGRDPEIYAEPYTRNHADKLQRDFYWFRDDLMNISTKFSISSKEVDELYVAAKLLTWDPASRNTICRWMREMTGKDCREPAP